MADNLTGEKGDAGEKPPVDNSPSTEKQDNGWDSEKFKSYQRSFPKRFWGNEKLQGFENMEQFLESATADPVKKAPEDYGDLGLGGDEADFKGIFKELDLDSASARKMAEFIGKRYSKPDTDSILKERYGNRVNEARELSSKAFSAFGDKSLDEMAEKYGLKSNPAFIVFAERIGKEIGEDFRNFNSGAGRPSDNGYVAMAKKMASRK